MAGEDGSRNGPMMMAAAAGGAAGAARPPKGAPSQPGKRIEVPIKKAGSGIEEKLHTWPFLVRSEFLMAALVIVVLTVWSLTINAPLEEPSNPTRTPNPSKAPSYFLGLQEMLVFFDPWYAGVVLPSFIIVGLMLIPYLDINPKGNGYYTFRERTFEILSFFVGFHVLWVSFILIGTFFRGPGWNWFWPGQYCDPHMVEALTNVDLPYLFGFRDYVISENLRSLADWRLFRRRLRALLLVVAPAPGQRSVVGISRWGPELLAKWGPVRFGITGFLLLAMAGVFIKMALRHALNIKYILVTPWINI